MKSFIRILFTVLVTLLGMVAWHSGFKPKNFAFVASLAIYFDALPILLFTILILWPVEALLRRAHFVAAIIVVAPVLGFLAPYSLLLFAPNHDNAMAAIVYSRWSGLLCGFAWALSYFVRGDRDERRSARPVI